MKDKRHLPGFASCLQAILALEGMMNSSRKPRKGSAASREAAYSFVSASAGNTGLDGLVPLDRVIILALVRRSKMSGNEMSAQN